MLRLIPKGGSKNQVLAKKSDNEYEFEWQDSANSNVYNSISKLDDYLYEVVYLDTDDEYAREYFLQRKPEVSPGACSSFIHYDNDKRKFIRFFDWVYNNNVEFIVKTPARDGKYAVEGVAGGTLGLTKDLVENGKYSELYKILPYYMTDGHNEHGLVISTNVVPLQKGKTIGTIPKREVRDQICATMLVRYLLEKCKTAEEAVTLIDNYVSVYSNASLHNLNYEQHFLISDNKKCYCLEFVENTVRILEKNAITNFYLADTTVQGNQHYNTPLTAIDGKYASDQGVTSHGSGLERYNIIRDSRDESVEELIPKLLYTNAYYPRYDEELDTTWYSEFVGEENGQELTVDNIPSDFKETIDKYYDIFINRSRDTANTWQSLHISIYDFYTNTFQIYVQENLNKKFDIKFNYPTMEKFVNELYTIDYNYNLYLSAQWYQKPTETTEETYIAKKMGYNPLKKDNKIFWFDIDSEDPNCVLKIFKDDNNEWCIQGQNDSAGKNRFFQVNFGSQIATFYTNTQKNFSNIYALYDEELIEIESEQDLHNLLAFNNSRLFLIAKSGGYWEIVKNKAKTNNSSLQTSSFKIETYTLDDIIEEIKNNYDDYGINLHAIPVGPPIYNEKYLRLSDSPIRKANKYNSAMLGDDINSHNSKNSLAIGSNLIQNNNNSLVIGQFNEKGNLPFVIGFGNNNNKKDILEINNGGNGTFGGNVISNNDVTCKNTYDGDTIISLRENGNKINEVWHGEYRTLISAYQYGINFIDGTAIAPITIPVELKADDNFIITIAKNKMSLKGNYIVTANDVENGAIDSQEIDGIIGVISYISLSNELFYENIQDEDGNLLNGIYYGSIYYISYKDPKPFKRISIIESPKNSTDGVNKTYVDDAIVGLQGELDKKFNITGGYISGSITINEDLTICNNINGTGIYGRNGTLNINSVDNVALTGTRVHVHSEEFDDDSVISKKYVDDAIDGINAKIPAQASTTNQLADKDFVNSSIENVAAYFITKDAAGNPFATKAELDAATVFYSGGQVRVPTRNDYTVVLHDESKLIGEEAPTTRYLYFNGWAYQYIVNNSGLTADQWKAVNSGITADILDELASKEYAEQAANQALADAKIYTDNIVGNIELAINTIRGVTTE